MNALHGQLGSTWLRVARWVSPIFLVNAYNWMHIEHGPHHAHVSDFPADPDDFDRILRGDIAKAVTSTRVVLFGAGRPFIERIAVLPAWLAVASVASVNWKLHVPVMLASYMLNFGVTQLFHHSRHIDCRWHRDRVAHAGRRGSS